MNNFKIRDINNGKKEIFDNIRKKYVAMTEEEIVRQHFIAFLIEKLSIPMGNIGIEQGLKVAKLDKRTDIVVYDRQGTASLIVECKAPHVEITQTVFDQIARYNLTLKVKFLVVTNGKKTYCCKINYENQSYDFIANVPNWEIINLQIKP